MTIQLLKVLVVAMGALILAGLAVIGVTIANRLGAMSQPRAGDIEVAVPAGSTVVETTAAGDRLVLRLDTPAGPRLVVVRLSDGTVEATIVLVPAP
ncbi:MAG TPA: hypothetical protein VGB88_09495 [Alphaproteobacteria bacterium]